MVGLPVAQFPKVVPPEIFIQANYVGADAQTIEQSVATPIEQQMSGVDNMNYMYSINANNGLMRMFVNFDLATDPNIDHVLTQLRYAQAESQLPADVRNYGVTVQKSLSAPLILIALNSPKGTRDAEFLANYAYINLSDALSRVPGISQVHDLRRRTVCDAHLGEAGSTGQAQHHRPGDHQRDQQPEHRQPGRQTRRPAQPARAGIHLHRSRAGPARLGGGVCEHRASRHAGRLDRAAEGCGPHRTGRGGLRHRGPFQPANPAPFWPCINFPAPTPSKRPRASKGSWPS